MAEHNGMFLGKRSQGGKIKLDFVEFFKKFLESGISLTFTAPA